MLVKTLLSVALLLLDVTFGTEFTCSDFPLSVCDDPLNPNFRWPQSEREMNDLCRASLASHDCLGEFEKKCLPNGNNGWSLNGRTDKIFQEGEFDSKRNVIVDICTKGTEINAVLFPNLKCIKNAYDNRFAECPADYLLKAAYKQLQSSDGERDMKESCLEMFYGMGCAFKSASVNCGKPVKDAMIEVINRSYYCTFGCPVEDIRAIRDMVDQLQIDEEQREILHEVFRTLEWEKYKI